MITIIYYVENNLPKELLDDLEFDQIDKRVLYSFCFIPCFNTLFCLTALYNYISKD